MDEVTDSLEIFKVLCEHNKFMGRELDNKKLVMLTKRKLKVQFDMLCHFYGERYVNTILEVVRNAKKS